jgi:hypothetical protein
MIGSDRKWPEAIGSDRDRSCNICGVWCDHVIIANGAEMRKYMNSELWGSSPVPQYCTQKVHHLSGPLKYPTRWWARYHSTCVFSHFTALILPQMDNHVNASHVTNVTWPSPTHSNVIRSIPMKIMFGPIIIQFYCTLLLHRCPAIAKSQGRKTSSNFINRNPSFSSSLTHRHSKTARLRQQTRIGISSASVIWNYRAVTWSADDPNMVTHLLDFVCAVVRKFSFHWDGIPFYEGELPSLFRLGVRLCLTLAFLSTVKG